MAYFTIGHVMHGYMFECILYIMYYTTHGMILARVVGSPPQLALCQDTVMSRVYNICV